MVGVVDCLLFDAGGEGGGVGAVGAGEGCEVVFASGEEGGGEE